MIRRIEMRLRKLARHKRAAILLVAAAPLMIRALILPWLPIPNPRVQDEFSHLLVADTFAHGRLVNPAHPMWVHFESMHTLVRPVYASVFPVAPGLIMAAAQAVTGRPWIGVWLGVGFMCGALCWMLQGWVPPHWALLGAALVAVRFGVFSYWMNSYYGGAVAAAGGALALGALPRIFHRSRWADGAILGIGLAILANSRPYEGALLGLPVMATLIWGIVTKRCGRGFLLPLALTLGVTAVAMSFYFARVTGNPLQLPYSYYRNTFTMAPHFMWQSPRPEPICHHRVLRTFYTYWEMGCYDKARSNRPPYGLADKVKSYWRFYTGPFLTIPFVTAFWLWRRRRTRYLLLASVFFAVGLAVEVWHAPQYAAPAMGLMLLVVIEGLRHLRISLGRWAVAAIVLAVALSPVIGGNGRMGGGGDRARILRNLESTGERHLVLVRYRKTHDVGDEWVYNSADIDGARVVWAREMDPTSNREIVGYFQGRKVWLVEPDAPQISLQPYDPSTPPDPPFQFVKLGTQAITALRDPEKIGRNIRQRTAAPSLSCDQWDYLFTAVTGVEAPDASENRSRLLSFEEWFAWLKEQR